MFTDVQLTAFGAIPGWLSRGEGEALYAAATGKRVVVELGSWKGRSTVALAFGCQGVGVVYAIDHWRGSVDDRKDVQIEAANGTPLAVYREFLRNLSVLGLLGTVVAPLVSDHVEAVALVEEQVDVLFIDGEHSREAVLAQFEAWSPKLAPGATVLFHDSHFPGVSGALKVLALGTLERVGSLAIWRAP